MNARRIIVGVSGSVGSLAALRAAVEEARRTGTDRVGAVLAWAPPGGELTGCSPAPPQLLEAWVAAARSRLSAAFDEALGGIPDDVLVHRYLIRGRPGHVLVDLVQPHDLLVVGAGDHGPVHRLLVGSVSRHCLSRAPCPVLVVPPPALLRSAQTRRLARLTHWHRIAPYPW